MKVLISVFNISGYLLAEVKELSKVAAVTIVETHCNLSESARMNFSQVNFIDREEVPAFDDFGNGDVFICGGWADKGMLQLAYKLKKQGTKTVVVLDTPWQGRLKQYVNCVVNRVWLPRLFDFGWGAGAPQARYLRNLGFKNEQIRTGMYCADTEKFAKLAKVRRDRWPHNFLYVGRYVAVKNMRRMESAFLQAIEEMPESDWNLVCIGGGDLWDERTVHPRIQHMGYIVPDRLQKHVGNAGCFVLPSIFEPWGVVTHEFAIMGLPLLCSKDVQSASEFLKDGENGYKFDPLDEESIKNAMLKVMRMEDEKLRMMGEISHTIGMSRTTTDWARQVLAFGQDKAKICVS